jgi:tetratricopeptide (TPR) repeat protein
MSSYMRIVVKIFVGAVPVALWLGFVVCAAGCRGDEGKGAGHDEIATSSDLPHGDGHSQKRSEGLYRDAPGELRKDASGVPEVDRLIAEARKQYYRYGNIAAADSLGTLAVQQAGMTYQTRVILHALNAWMGMYELGYDHAKALGYAAQAEELVVQTEIQHIVWSTYNNLAQVWNNDRNFEKAIGFAHRSLATAESAGETGLRTLSLLQIGNILHNNNQVIEGFRYYLNALTIAEETREPHLLIACYKTLSSFYDLNKGYEKAISYKMKEIELISARRPVDSVALSWAQVNLEEIYFSCNNMVHEEKLCALIAFAERQQNNFMKQFILAMFRSYLMNSNLFVRLRILYEEKYPVELEYLKQHQPGIYWRLQAIFLELDNLPDSAYACYQRGAEIAGRSGAMVMEANCYIRFGEFLQRIGRDQDAVEKHLRAFELASAAGYFEYSLKAAGALEGLYEQQGNFRDALLFAQRSRALTDSIAKMNRKEEMLTLEIRNAEQIREINLRTETLATQRRNNIQYTFILLLMIAFFVVLVMLGSFKVSATVVRILGFISFIFFFEFIILLADNWIHHVTHGEPLKVLGIKVVLIAFLLPLHHWSEKRVTHYLLNRKLLRFGKSKIVAFLRGLGSTAREIWGRGS